MDNILSAQAIDVSSIFFKKSHAGLGSHVDQMCMFDQWAIGPSIFFISLFF
jgi:hypothetical protein